MSFPMLILCILLIVFALLFSVVPFAMGKAGRRRALRPVEYYPPRGYSPADVMIAYYGRSSRPRELFNPLMLYWADRGFVTIEEDCKRGLKLTKLKELEPPEVAKVAAGRDAVKAVIDATVAKKRGRKRKRPVAIEFDIKALPYDGFSYNAEKRLFDAVFSSGDVFYTLAAPSSFNKNYEEFENKCAEKAKVTNSNRGKSLSRAAYAVSFLVFAAVAIISGVCVRNTVYVAMIFPLVAMIMCPVMPIKFYFKYLFFAVWGGAPFATVLAFSPTDCTVLLVAAFLVDFLTVFVISPRIDIRSKAELEVYGRICAFKTFLEQAEADRLETLIEDNPDYWFDILPYCYVLKITEKLKPKFDRIAMDGPSWYLGELRDTLMF